MNWRKLAAALGKWLIRKASEDVAKKLKARKEKAAHVRPE